MWNSRVVGHLCNTCSTYPIKGLVDTWTSQWIVLINCGNRYIEFKYFLPSSLSWYLNDQVSGSFNILYMHELQDQILTCEILTKQGLALYLTINVVVTKYITFWNIAWHVMPTIWIHQGTSWKEMPTNKLHNVPSSCINRKVLRCHFSFFTYRMMHLALVILSLALGLSTGAKIEMDKETDFGNPNINLNDNFNLNFVSLEETRQGECYNLITKPCT